MIGLLLFKKVHVLHITLFSTIQTSAIIDSPPPPQQYTSLSLLSSIPIPKSPGEALSHPEMRCVPFKLVILRSWFLFRLSNQLLVLMVVYS